MLTPVVLACRATIFIATRGRATLPGLFLLTGTTPGRLPGRGINPCSPRETPLCLLAGGLIPLAPIARAIRLAARRPPPPPMPF